MVCGPHQRCEGPPQLLQEEKASFEASRLDFFGLSRYGTGSVSFDAASQWSSTRAGLVGPGHLEGKYDPRRTVYHYSYICEM